MSFHHWPRTAGILLSILIIFTALFIPAQGDDGAQGSDGRLLMLRTGAFDPLATELPPVRIGAAQLETTNLQARASRQALANANRSGDTSSYFIVQFDDAIRPEQTEALRARGNTIVGYLPHNAYIVRADGRQNAQALTLNSSGAYRWVGAYGAGLKVEPELAKTSDEIAAASVDGANGGDGEDVTIAALSFPGAEPLQLQQLSGTLPLAGEPIFEERADGRLWSVLRVARRSLPEVVAAVAGIEGIEWIEPRGTRKLFNDNAVRVVQTGTAGADTPLYRRGLTGAGQIYAAADSGLDSDHAQFRSNNQPSSQTLSFAVSTSALTNGRFPVNITNPSSRVLVYYLLGSGAFLDNTSNPNGGRTLNPTERQGSGSSAPYRNALAYDDSSGGFHGTATTSVAVGRHFAANGSGAVPGIATRTSFDGVAPDAKIVFQDIGHVSGQLPGVDFVSQTLIHEQAYASGARVHNDSYGPDPPVGYDTDAADIDDIMWRLRDYSIFYSAGNDGVTARRISNGAKNNVLVAATESPTTGGSIENLADYSSHGPTSDGRIKPDIAAPGFVRAATEGSGQVATGFSNRTSTTAQDAAINPRDPNSNQDFAITSGTSFASPLVAGGAVLVRQYFVDGFYPSGEKNAGNGFNPSNALVKGIILNSGRNMTGRNTASDGSAGARGPLPNFGQGWGRIALDDTLFFNGDRRELKVLADVYNGATSAGTDSRPAPNPAIQTGQTHTYTINDVSPIEPLRVTLVWSDPRASVISAVALVNNLDLEVTDPQGRVFRGNVGFADGYTQPANGASFDNRNPVEGIYIQYPLAGNYTVKVIGANIPGNGMMGVAAQPSNQTIDSNRQGYALVASGNFTAGAQPVVAFQAATISGGVNADRFIGRNETVTATIEALNPTAIVAQNVRVDISVDPSSPIPAHLVRLNGGQPGAAATIDYGDLTAGVKKSVAFQVTLIDDGNVRAGQLILLNVVLTPSNGVSFTTQITLIAQQRLLVYRTRFEPTADQGGGGANGETIIVVPESAWGLREDNPNPSPSTDRLFLDTPWQLTTALKAATEGSTASLTDPSGPGTSYGVSRTSRAGLGIFDDTRWWTTRKIVLPGLNVSPTTGLVTNPELTRDLQTTIDSYDVDVSADYTGDTPQSDNVGDLFFLRVRTYRNTASTTVTTDAGFNDVSFSNLLQLDSTTPSTGGFKHFNGSGFSLGTGSFTVDSANPNNSDVAFRLELQLRRNGFTQTGDGIAVDNLLVRLRIGDPTIYTALPAQAMTSVSAASFTRIAAPGQILAGFGAGMPANQNFTSVAGMLPLPTQLSDVAVRVNGIDAPLFFVSSNNGSFQINYQLPYETPPGVALVEVFRSGVVFATEFLSVSDVAPGVFTLTSDGQGQATALNQNFSINGSMNPEVRGNFVIVYATGQGKGLLDSTTRQPAMPASGNVAGNSPLFVTATDPSVTIGGVPAPVGFSGLAPGFVGLWQLNVQIPANAPTGAAVPLIISSGGNVSNTTTIAVN
jgi:uncharacterized protein (TIGR03437 family)